MYLFLITILASPPLPSDTCHKLAHRRAMRGGGDTRFEAGSVLGRDGDNAQGSSQEECAVLGHPCKKLKVDF